MKFSAYILPSVFICLIFLAWQEFDNARREEQARALIAEAEKGPDEGMEVNKLEAIELLEYQNLLGHNVVVNAYLVGYYYYSLVFTVESADKKTDYAQKAMAYFLLSTQQTPTVATGWANLAQLGWLTGNADRKFSLYFTQAHRLGLYEFQAHAKIITLGVWMLESEHTMTDDEKAIILHHLKYGIADSKSKTNIKNLVLNSPKAQVKLCGWLDEKSSVRTQLKCR